MARSVTQATQTAETLSHYVQFLQDQITALQGAITLMQLEPPIAEISVTHETSREVGMEYIENWASAAKRAAFKARTSPSPESQIPSVRESDTPRPSRKKRRD